MCVHTGVLASNDCSGRVTGGAARRDAGGASVASLSRGLVSGERASSRLARGRCSPVRQRFSLQLLHLRPTSGLARTQRAREVAQAHRFRRVCGAGAAPVSRVRPAVTLHRDPC